MTTGGLIKVVIICTVMDEGEPYQRKTHKKRKKGVFFKRGGPHRTKKFANG
jgi:hypothetical protein